MSYPPVGYIITKLLKPDYDWSESVGYMSDYDKAKEYCDKKNKEENDGRWYYEPNEVDILD